MFVGAVADNIDQPIEQKIFHARIDLDTRRITAETAAYVPIPELASFVDENGTDRMDEVVRRIISVSKPMSRRLFDERSNA